MLYFAGLYETAGNIGTRYLGVEPTNARDCYHSSLKCNSKFLGLLDPASLL